MNIFIDTPQRAAERAERIRRQRDAQPDHHIRRGAAAGSEESPEPTRTAMEESGLDLDEVPGCEPGGTRASHGGRAARNRRAQRESPGERRASDDAQPQSVAADAYRAEKAYDRKRARRRKRGQVLRAVALVLLMPVVAVAVFLVSYVLTCVLSGATPDEVVASLRDLVLRVEGFLTQAGII